MPAFEFDSEDEPVSKPITNNEKKPTSVEKKSDSPKPAADDRKERSDRKERRERREKGEKGKEGEKKKRGDKRSKKKRTKPTALTTIIYPAIDKLSDTDDDRLVAALEHLKGTFDKAERLQPGISHALIAQIIDTLKKSAQ